MVFYLVGTRVQIQQFFFNSTELGKIEEQNWVERQNGAGSNLFSHEQKFLEMNLEEMPLEKLLKIQQILSIKLHNKTKIGKIKLQNRLERQNGAAINFFH